MKVKQSGSTALTVVAFLGGLFLLLGILYYATLLVANLSGDHDHQNYADVRDSETGFTGNDYRKGLEEQIYGDPEQAAEYFTEAKNNAINPYEEGQARLKAVIVRTWGKAPEEIADLFPEFKAIAASEQYTPFIRANAIEYMARLYYIDYSDVYLGAIFNGEPYESFFVEGDVNASMLNLYEYASSIFPTPDAELQIARWYANELYDMGGVNSPTLDPGVKRAFMLIFEEKISNAREQLEAAERNAQSVTISSTNNVMRWTSSMARALAALERAGVTEYGSAAEYYDKAEQIALAQQSPNNAAFIRFNKSTYLSRVYGTARLEEIQALNRPLYGTDEFENSPLLTFLRNAAAAEGTTGHQAVVDVASVDPDFKAYVNTLGWSL